MPVHEPNAARAIWPSLWNRRKEVLTVLSRVAVQRAYYYCSVCAGGVIPKDQELDIVGTCFSPGVRRLMGNAGGKDSFAEGRKDLEELAGIRVKTKSVERVSEALGGQIEGSSQQERELALSGKLVSFQPVPLLYLALDGTASSKALLVDLHKSPCVRQPFAEISGSIAFSSPCFLSRKLCPIFVCQFKGSLPSWPLSNCIRNPAASPAATRRKWQGPAESLP